MFRRLQGHLRYCTSRLDWDARQLLSYNRIFLQILAVITKIMIRRILKAIRIKLKAEDPVGGTRLLSSSSSHNTVL